MSKINKTLLYLYELGVDDRHMRALSAPSAYRIHRYFLDNATDSPDTYTGIDETADHLNIAYSTAYRTIHSLGRLGLLESKRIPARQNSKWGGGKHRTVWRTKLEGYPL